MSDQEVTLVLEQREIVRKGLNQLKKQGQIPAVIQDPGKESINVSANLTDVSKVFRQVGKRHPVNITVGSKNYLTIIKDVDFDPKKHIMRHLVFAIIKQDEKVETEVPIVLIGDAPAVKAGLVLDKQMDHITIEAFPKDLPDEVTVNIEGLVNKGDRVTVADIVAISGVTVLEEPEHPIATIEEPKVQEEEEIVEEVATESTEQTEVSEEE